MTDAAPAVSVFAPSPVLTVTAERGEGDHADVHVHAGGQGPWVANMLSVLQVRSVLCAPFGGEIGLVLATVLDQEDLEVRGVSISGSNGCYVEDRRSGDLECLADMPATRLNRHESDELCNQMLAAGAETGVAVLTGPAGEAAVEPDVYRRVAADLRSLGVTVVADLSGEVLEAAVQGGVSVLKISDQETPGDDPLQAAGELRKRVDDLVVLTRGSRPALLFGEGPDDLRQVEVPELQTVNHRGAGDSMTAGIAAGLAYGLTLTDAVRLGAAAGAVNVTRHGLASGRRDTIEQVARQVSVHPVDTDPRAHRQEKEVGRASAHHQ